MPKMPSEPIWHHSGCSLSHTICLVKGRLASSSKSWVIEWHYNKSQWQTTDHNKDQTSDRSEVQVPLSTISRVTLCQLWQQRVALWAACVINAWQVWLYSKRKCIWKVNTTFSPPGCANKSVVQLASCILKDATTAVEAICIHTSVIDIYAW